MIGGVEIEIDEEGFIQEPEKWNQTVAEDLAKIEKTCPLSEDHWKVINCIRNFYLEHKIAPPIRMLCKRTGFKLSYIKQLFVNGPARGACKVAGLPKPTGCV